jgi:hypothetical protein
MIDPNTQAARFLAMEAGFKAAGLVADVMLDALQTQHPDKAATLVAAVERGMHIAVQFVISDVDAKAVLQLVDDYGKATELAAVPATLRNRDEIAKN